MKNSWMSFIFILTGISLSNCEYDSYERNTSKYNQRIFFQYEYVNFAWGYQHVGWLIDANGNIYCYNNPENWHYDDSTGYISSRDMNCNISETDSICFKIDSNELDDKIGLIIDASKGDISEPVHEMYDAGSVVYCGYIYNTYDQKYKKILFKQLGDIRIENSSKASVDLYEWLDSINHLIYNIQ